MTLWAGDTSVAQSIVQSKRLNRVVVLSDSTFVQGIVNTSLRTMRIPKVTGMWWTAGLGLGTGVFATSYATISRGSSGGALNNPMNYSATGSSTETVFNGTAIPDDLGNLAANRLFSVSLSTSTIAGDNTTYPPDGDQQSPNINVNQGNWLQQAIDRSATLKVKIYYLANPQGVVNPTFYIQVRGGSGVFNIVGNTSSTPFSTYSATTELKVAILTLPAFAISYTMGYYAIEVIGKIGENPGNGKNCIIIAACITTDESDGFEMMSIGQGGESIANTGANNTYLTTNRWATGIWSQLAFMGFNTCMIYCGFNDGNNMGNTSWITNYQATIDALKTAIGSTLKFILVAQHDINYPTAQVAGRDAIFSLSTANQNSVGLDIYTALGKYDALWQRITGSWISNCMYFPLDVVLHSGVWYVCKTAGSGVSSTTAPNSDATNWVAIPGVSPISGSRYSSDRNLVSGDGVHMNQRGVALLASTIISLLETSSRGTGINGSSVLGMAL